jgi:CRP-like cAMP-binding protein
MTDKMELDQKTLQKFIPFQTLPPVHLNDLIKGATLQTVDRGAILFKATDHAKHSFYVLSGSVDLRDTEGKKLSTVVADSHSAQRALHAQYGQPVTAVAAAHSIVLMIDKNLIDLVLTWDQAGEYVVADLAAGNHKKAGAESDWMSSLLESPLFTQIPAANIQQLFTKFESLPAHPGQVVIKEGDVGDYFYVLSEGTAKVIRHLGATDETMLAELGTGSFFGEEALISDAPRNASIVMTTAGLLKRLQKNDFSNLLHKPLLNYLNKAQLDAILKNPDYKTVIVDVRLAAEYDGEHMENSINIPLPELRSKLPNLATDAVYVTTCDGGRRREIAAHMLSQAGLNAYILKS